MKRDLAGYLKLLKLNKSHLLYKVLRMVKKLERKTKILERNSFQLSLLGPLMKIAIGIKPMSAFLLIEHFK